MFLLVIHAGREPCGVPTVVQLRAPCFHVSLLQCAVVLAGGLADCLLNQLHCCSYRPPGLLQQLLLYPLDSCSNHFEPLFICGTDVTTVEVTIFIPLALASREIVRNPALLMQQRGVMAIQISVKNALFTSGLALAVLSCDHMDLDSGLSAGDNCTDL